MSQQIIKLVPDSSIPTPSTGYSTFYIDDNSKPKLKLDDGSIIELFSGINTGGATPYGVASGTDNYVVSVTPVPTAITTGMIFNIRFTNTNTGPSTIVINGSPVITLVKDGGNPLTGGELQADTVYTFVFNGINLDIIGETITANGLLGLPTDTTWDGLYDHQGQSVEDALDLHNVVLAALVPKPAPALGNTTSGIKAGVVSGKLSFDTLNPIGGYLAADDVGIPVPTSVDGLFAIGSKRLGISAQSGDVTGVLNDGVVAGSGTPNPAYPAKSFSKADEGFLRLIVNGINISQIALSSTTSAIDNTVGGTASGFSVSVLNNALFPGGDPFTGFKNRTGSWIVKQSDLSLGYNSIVIEHQNNSTTITLSRFEIVIDGDNTPTAYSGAGLSNPIMSGSKKLSGIDYHTGGTIKYSLNVDNAYRNTYSPSSAAISHSSSSNSYGTHLSCPSQSLANNAGNEAMQVVIANKVATFEANRRIIREDVTLQTTVLRTVQSSTIGGLASLGKFLLDNVASGNTNTFESFDDESFRLQSIAPCNLISDMTNPSYAWSSQESLVDGTPGHITGLQIIDGKLIYPGAHLTYPKDFRTTNIVYGSSFNDGGVGGSGRNYNLATGDRTFVRKFLQVAPTTANFIMTILGSGGTFVPLSTPLTGNNIHVEIKAPSQTGWMDAYGDFSTGIWTDGAGARNATNGVGRAFGTAWGLTIGTKNTALTGGYMVVRITVGSAFTGELNSINFQFN